MIKLLNRIPQARRVALAVWVVNLILLCVLIAFATRQ